MTNEVSNIFNELVKIQHWPNVGLAFALAIVVGYCFRLWKWFPNAAIPVVVILTAALCTLILAPTHPPRFTALQWHFRTAVVGAIVGFIAWMAHNIVLSKIEDWLASKFSVVSNLLNKTIPPKP